MFIYTKPTHTLTKEDVRSLTLSEFTELLESGFICPIAGAEEGDEPGSEKESKNDPSSQQEGSGSSEGSSGGDPSSRQNQSNSGAKEDEEDPDKAEVSKSELQRLKRIAAEADKAKRDVEKAKKDSAEREKREAGRWEELLKEKDDEVGTANKRAEEAEKSLVEFKREILVTKVASRLGAKDPSDMHLYISPDETTDEQSTERALKRVQRAKPWLFDKPKSSGAPVNGENGGTNLTIEEIKKMSTDQVNARWPEVQKVMASQGRS